MKSGAEKRIFYDFIQTFAGGWQISATRIQSKILMGHCGAQTRSYSWQPKTRKTNDIFSTCLPPVSCLSSSRQQQLQLQQKVGRSAPKPEAPRAPRTSPSSAPRVPKRDATDGKKERRRRAKVPTRSFPSPGLRTVWGNLAAASLWMQTYSTMTWNVPLHIRFSTICLCVICFYRDILLPCSSAKVLSSTAHFMLL